MVTPRPKPTDFRSVYVAAGWAGVRKRYGAGTATITRWVAEEGRNELVAERDAHVAAVAEQVRQFRDQIARLGTATGVPEPYAGIIRAEERAVRLGTAGASTIDHDRKLRA